MAKLSFNESLCKGRAAFNRIAYLQNYIINNPDSEITIEISSNGRTGLTFVFMIGTLLETAKSNNKMIHIRLSKKLYALYSRIQSIEKSKNGNLSDPGYRRIKEEADIFKLVTEITKQAPVKFSDKLADILVGRMGEMYINALSHSGANSIIGGKYFKHRQRYCFTCYDDGIGIPNSVNDFLKNLNLKPLTDEDALRWAIQDGNTTKMFDKGVSRGIGLSTLRSFAKANDGVIRICSGHALYIFNGIEEKFYNLDYLFQGTLFEMDIITDNKHKYKLKSE